MKIIIFEIHDGAALFCIGAAEFQVMDRILSELGKEHIVIENECENEWEPDRIESVRLYNAGFARVEIECEE